MRWSAGDESALEFVTPLVYEELRRLGRSALRRSGPDSIVQPTVLVHEAWLRLAGNQRFEISNRAQFYGLASKIMRDILVDALRRRRAAKRGGSRVSVSLDESDAAMLPRSIDFLILDDALTRLGQIGDR